MTRLGIARSAALIALAGTLLVGGTVAAASGGSSSAVAAECLAPRPDSASGATFTITSGTVQPGGAITFTGTGFQRTQTDNLGQTLSFKLNDQSQWVETVKADDSGNVSGSLSLADLPAADVADMGEQACGTYWVRVLVGSGAAGDMAPSRTLHATFVLASSPAETPAPGASATPIAGSSGGQLPQTGIEDMPPLVWMGGLALVAVAAIAAERVVSRRRRTAHG